jgi:glutamine---fructose-6-phosphate transaminase (isomerizing)
MYEAIQAQPATWTRVAGRARDQARHLARLTTANQRIYLVGTGTSYHAAQTGENILRAYSGTNDVRAVTAFEFALYTPALHKSDVVIVISHRGTKTYSVKSLEIAQAAGCRSVLITGEGPHAVPTPGLVDDVFVGAPQEDSAAHTVSYTASVSILSVLAQELGLAWHARNGLAAEVLEETIPRALETALAVESQTARLAHEFVNSRRIWIVGGGPAAIVATETALKIKETSYLQAEGLATEMMIHGPFLAVEAEDGFALIAPKGAASERTMALAGMVREVGAPYFVVGDRPAPFDLPPGNEKGWVQVPPVPEPFSTLTTLVPMQLFTYHLALERGRNPDVFRRDDPRFARSGQLVKL